MLDIVYYPEGSSGPVREYLILLAGERPDAFARLAVDLEVLGSEGLRSSQISIRSLGEKLWELRRLYKGVQYQAFFGVDKGIVWLLHCIEKKSAKTPIDDLRLARKRLKEVLNNEKFR